VKPANFHDKVVRDQKDGALFWKMTEGRGNMPAYGQVLSEQNRWALVLYIRRLSSQNNGTLTYSKAGTSLPLANFTIDPKMVSQYFPLPHKVLNVTRSETQLFMVDTVLSGLKMPWSMVFLPDKSVLIAERAGNLLRVRNGKVEKSIGGNVPNELRDIKLHPQYEKNGLIYISYYIDPSKQDGGYTALMKARLDGDKLVDDKVLYKAGPFNQTAFWYGSRMTFDRAGYLYFTVGITGDRKNAQDLSNHAGKTMRLKDDGSIPPDNPFVHTSGALPEIYSYGHRMHQGLAYDPKTDKIWSSEFGEMGGDELNIIKRGANYGWPEVTFSLEYTGKIISKDSLRADIEPPVHHWMIAPGNLDFVYGDRYPAWDGNVFIGALHKDKRLLLRTVIKNNVFIHDEKLLENIGRVRDVKFGPDKFLYVLTEDTGLLVRLVPVRKK
jgi:glucose/arabinose dehydrogenase